MWYEHCQVFFVMYYQPLQVPILQLQGSLKGFLIQNPLQQDTHDYGTLTRYFATLGQYINRRIYHYGT